MLETSRAPAEASAQKAYDLSIVLPTFNESENILVLIDRLVVLFADVSTEIIVVDDNSPDGTADLVRSTYSNNADIKVIGRNAAPSLGGAIFDGMAASVGRRILVMDSDFNHDPDDAPGLEQALADYDVVIGSRFVKGGRATDGLHYILSRSYNVFMQILLGTRVRDNLSGFFAIRREAFCSLDHKKIFWGFGDFFFRLLLKTQEAGLRHKEIAVVYGARRGGVSKSSFLRIFSRYTREVIWLFWMKQTGKW